MKFANRFLLVPQLVVADAQDIAAGHLAIRIALPYQHGQYTESGFNRLPRPVLPRKLNRSFEGCLNRLLIILYDHVIDPGIYRVGPRLVRERCSHPLFQG